MGCLKTGGLFRSIAGFGALALLSLDQGCSVYDESLLGTAGAAATKCEHTQPPPKPSGSNLGDGTNFVVALRNLDFGEPYAPDEQSSVRPVPPLGYDLDGKCTENQNATDPTLSEGNGCNPRAGADVGDLAGGRDNAFRRVAESFTLLANYLDTQTYRKRIDNGDVSLLFEVRKYNGKSDDDAVELAVYAPDTFKQQPGNTEGPTFQGADVWPVSSGSYNGDQPRLVFTNAYVTNNRLVATAPNLELPLPATVINGHASPIILSLVKPIFSAKITKQNDLWWLKEGQIAGGWRVADLFAELQYFPSPGGLGVCIGSSPYFGLRGKICGSADLILLAGVPNPTCDALSLGIGFEAVQAQLGDRINVPARQGGCPGQSNPANDTCQ